MQVQDFLSAVSAAVKPLAQKELQKLVDERYVLYVCMYVCMYYDVAS